MRWKKWHGVHMLDVYSEKLLAGSVATTEFSAKYLNIIKENHLHPEQLYNMYEMGINFKLPPKNMANNYQHRLSVGLCFNSIGTHKLSLFVIRKLQKTL